MFKTIVTKRVIFDSITENVDLGRDIDEQVKEFLKKNPSMKEVNRSAPSITSTPRGEYGDGVIVIIAVTCEFQPSAHK